MRAYAKENKKTNDWKPRSGGTEKNKFTDPDLNNEWNKMESNSSVMLFMSHFRFRDCQPYIVNANVLKLMEYEMLNSIKQSLSILTTSTFNISQLIFVSLSAFCLGLAYVTAKKKHTKYISENNTMWASVFRGLFSNELRQTAIVK